MKEEHKPNQVLRIGTKRTDFDLQVTLAASFILKLLY